MEKDGVNSNDHSVVHLIEKKRDGKELTHDEIQSFINHTVSGTAQDCQIGAMLMAIYQQGLSDKETVSLTKCMIDSGEVLTWPKEWSSLLVDKHSTGGVGDKISLVLAPALASCGLKVPMISGRGLDFTGGTLDKLESIPGYQVQLTKEQMVEALSKVGCFIAGQTSSLVPADMELYKRRDVTATVPSPGLIVGSILSKKAAEGVSSMILDLKVGKAAFNKSVEVATVLANKIIQTSKILGLQTRVAFTRMDSPLGCNVGNALEVAESVHCMQGKGPEDIECLVEELGANLLEISGLVKSLEDGKNKIHKSLHDGSALHHFGMMLEVHGVDPKVAKQLCNDPWAVLPAVPKSQITLLAAKKSGKISDVDAMIVAQCCRDLGAGRMKSSQPIDPRVGVRLLMKEGHKLEKGTPWIEVHHSTPQLPESIRNRLDDAITINDGTDVPKKSLIIQVLS